MRLNNYLQTIGGTNRLSWSRPVKEGPDDSPQWTINAYCQSSHHLVCSDLTRFVVDGTEFSGTGRDLGIAKEEAARQVLESLLAA